jgi:hypothetical protein
MSGTHAATLPQKLAADLSLYLRVWLIPKYYTRLTKIDRDKRTSLVSDRGKKFYITDQPSKALTWFVACTTKLFMR